jgi:hypothetical protein
LGEFPIVFLLDITLTGLNSEPFYKKTKLELGYARRLPLPIANIAIAFFELLAAGRK